MQRRDWEQGTLAQAMVEAGDRHSVILLTKAAIVQKTPDGRLGVVNSGSPTDPAMGGAAYAKAAEWTGDAEMQQAVDGLLTWILKGAPRNADGILYHVFRGAEMWSDGLNCAPPFLAAMGFYDEALAQIEGYRQRLWNPDKKLLAHIWDDQKKQFKDGNFWGGGNGWAAAGLARVWRSLPSERRQAARISPILRERSSMAVSRASVPTAYFTTWSISPRPSSRPTSLRCSPSRSMKESRPAGFPPPIVPTRTGCARPLG